MFALIPRQGSGFTLHRGDLHGVSSFRLACGPLRLRQGLRLTETQPDPPPKGTHACPKCTT